MHIPARSGSLLPEGSRAEGTQILRFLKTQAESAGKLLFQPRQESYYRACSPGTVVQKQHYGSRVPLKRGPQEFPAAS
jgi:hypothetical protein